MEVGDNNILVCYKLTINIEKNVWSFELSLSIEEIVYTFPSFLQIISMLNKVFFMVLFFAFTS